MLLTLIACGPSRPPGVHLKPVSYAALQGWQTDNHEDALHAFRASCARLGSHLDEKSFGPNQDFRTFSAWRSVCRAANADNAMAARPFFERYFTPFRVTDAGGAQALITGYYEPLLQGAKRRSAKYPVPLYRPPDNMVSVDLGRFRQEWAGQSIVGLRAGRHILPMPTRGEIDAGALAGRDLELLWLKDPMAAFFLHIQGSGRVRLEDGRIIGVGFAGKNGHRYFPIGKELIRRGELEREEVSMQSIRAWLKAHPQDAADVMALNPSYVFFRIRDGLEGPIGSQGVALKPERSLAVDRNFLPLGAPMWVDTTHPVHRDQPLRRLMIAQDTGGAIKGPARADFFWGTGEAAAAAAGTMKAQGRLFILLPAKPGMS